MKVWRRTKDGTTGNKLAAIGKGISAGQISIGVAQGSAIALGGAVVVVECEADSKGFKVGRGIPLVSGYAAIKNPCAGPDRGLAIAKRVPCQAKARRNMAPGNGDNAASEPGISGEKYPQ